MILSIPPINMYAFQPLTLMVDGRPWVIEGIVIRVEAPRDDRWRMMVEIEAKEMKVTPRQLEVAFEGQRYRGIVASGSLGIHRTSMIQIALVPMEKASCV